MNSIYLFRSYSSRVKLYFPSSQRNLFTIRSVTSPEYYWTARKRQIDLALRDTSDKNQMWRLEHDNVRETIVDFKGENAITFTSGKKPLSLEPCDATRTDQRLAFKVGTNTAIQSQDTPAQFAIDDEKVVIAEHDSTPKWIIKSTEFRLETTD